MRLWYWFLEVWNPLNWPMTLFGGYARIRDIPFRLRNGFWPSEVWSLDVTIAKFVLPRLEYLRRVKQGIPTEFVRKYGREGGFVAWDDCMRDMLFALEAVAHRWDTGIGDWPESAEKSKRRGLKKFGYWFECLWD